MKAVLTILALLTTLAIPAHAQDAMRGPLYMVRFGVASLVDGGTVDVDTSGEHGNVVPIPEALAKDGWLCIISKKDRDNSKAIMQSVVCRHGKDENEVNFGVTAICVTFHQDIDVQRMSFGNSKQASGIVIKCTSEQATGAEL